MCVIVDLQEMFTHMMRTIFMTYLRTTFHLPDSNGSIVIGIKPKAKDNFRTATMLFSRNY
jgi:hypothetical protein